MDDRPGMGGALATAAAMCAVYITNDQGGQVWRHATWRRYALSRRRRDSGGAVDAVEEQRVPNKGLVYPS